MKRNIKDATYQFPPMTDEDKRQLRNYNLKLVKVESDGDCVVSGRVQDIEAYSHEYIGCALNYDYLVEDSCKDSVKDGEDKYHNQVLYDIYKALDDAGIRFSVDNNVFSFDSESDKYKADTIITKALKGRGSVSWGGALFGIKVYLNKYDAKKPKDSRPKFTKTELKDLHKLADAFKVKDAEYSKTTAMGYPILAKYKDGGRVHVIVKRPNGDYVIGLGYDETDGSWGQGRYDISSFAKAEEQLFYEKGKLTRIGDSKVKDNKWVITAGRNYSREKNDEELKKSYNIFCLQAFRIPEQDRPKYFFDKYVVSGGNYNDFLRAIKDSVKDADLPTKNPYDEGIYQCKNDEVISVCWDNAKGKYLFCFQKGGSPVLLDENNAKKLLNSYQAYRINDSLKPYKVNGKIVRASDELDAVKRYRKAKDVEPMSLQELEGFTSLTSTIDATIRVAQTKFGNDVQKIREYVKQNPHIPYNVDWKQDAIKQYIKKHHGIDM